MASDKLRAEWFWVDRWQTSSAMELPLIARGLYRELLSLAWMRGGQLPSDPERLRRLCRVSPEEWATAWPLVARYWQASEDGQTISNATQLEVLAETHEQIEAKSAAGKKAAETRWAKQREPKADAKRSATAHATAYATALRSQCPQDQDKDQIQTSTTDSASAEVAAVAATRAPRRRKVSKPQDAAATPAEAAPVYAEPPTPSPEPRGEPESTGGSPNASALVLAAPEAVSVEAVAVPGAKPPHECRQAWFGAWQAGRDAHQLGRIGKEDAAILARCLAEHWRAWGADAAADLRVRGAIEAWFGDEWGARVGFQVRRFLASIDACDLAARGVGPRKGAPPKPEQVGELTVAMTGHQRTDHRRRSIAEAITSFRPLASAKPTQEGPTRPPITAPERRQLTEGDRHAV